MSFKIGDRVLVFDSRWFVDDVSTPLSMTMRPAVIVGLFHCKCHGSPDCKGENCASVRFDGEEHESRGHFLSGLARPCFGCDKPVFPGQEGWEGQEGTVYCRKCPGD